MQWLKKAPPAVIIGFFVLTSVLAVAVIAAYVLIALQGDPQDLIDFRQTVQTIGISLVLPLLGVNTVATWAGGRAAAAAETNTNGALSARDERIAALEAQVAALVAGRTNTLRAGDER